MSEKMNWYAVRTQNNREKSVLEKLNLELLRTGLSDILGQTMIPTEKIFSVKNGKKIAKERILYPGYLFIQTSHVGEINTMLKTIKGSAGFVRTRTGDINPLQDVEVRRMMTDQEQSDSITPDDTLFSVGEEVKVIDGAFSTFRGSVRNIDEEKKRLKVEVLIFSRPTMVDLEFYQVERA